MGAWLDDWIYYTVRDYTQYSAIVILHTFQFTVAHALGFSVLTSHILATDLSQELSFQIIMKSSFHFVFNHLGMPTLHNSNKFSNANFFSSNPSYRLSLFRLGTGLQKTSLPLLLRKHVYRAVA
jgi:uncharacterized membrane protein YagU involved in acid resistance